MQLMPTMANSNAMAAMANANLMLMAMANLMPIVQFNTIFYAKSQRPNGTDANGQFTKCNQYQSWLIAMP